MTSEWRAAIEMKRKYAKQYEKKKKNEGKNWKENGEKRVRNIDGEQLESISNNVTPVIARALEKVVYHT